MAIECRGGASWNAISTEIWSAFESTSKRLRGYTSETRVKRGRRRVHGEKELVEKLGRNDLCPCGSRRRFQGLLPGQRPLRRRQQGPLLFATGELRGALSGEEGLAKGQILAALTLVSCTWGQGTQTTVSRQPVEVRLDCVAGARREACPLQSQSVEICANLWLDPSP